LEDKGVGAEVLLSSLIVFPRLSPRDPRRCMIWTVDRNLDIDSAGMLDGAAMESIGFDVAMKRGNA
jgi:hypothetical protein